MCLGSALIWVTNHGQKAKPDKWLKFMFFSFMILYIIIMTMDGGRHVAPNFKRMTLPLGSWKRQWKYCHHWRLRSRYQKFIYITKGSLLAGYLEFYFAKQRGGLDPLSLNDQEKGNPPLPPLKGHSRHMPGASLHAAAAPSQCLVIINIVIIIIILLITIIIRLEIRIFRHPFSKYPTVRWKWQVRASIGTAKRDIGVCAHTDRVFFSPHDACVWQCIPPNGYLNGLSDEQPWTSWGALFSDPDISALPWMSLRSVKAVIC